MDILLARELHGEACSRHLPRRSNPRRLAGTKLSFNNWLQKSSTSCEEGDTEVIASPLRDSRRQKDLRSSLQLVPQIRSVEREQRANYSTSNHHRPVAGRWTLDSLPPK